MSLPLHKLPPGRPAVVKSIVSDEAHWRKFMAFGIRPGVTLVVDQRFPALVITVGHTQVAMDFKAASLVEVEPSV